MIHCRYRHYVDAVSLVLFRVRITLVNLPSTNSVQPALHKLCSTCPPQTLFNLPSTNSVQPALHKLFSTCPPQTLFNLPSTNSVQPALHKLCSTCPPQTLFNLPSTNSVQPALHKLCSTCPPQTIFWLCPFPFSPGDRVSLGRRYSAHRWIQSKVLILSKLN